MRITGGAHRSRNLIAPRGQATRPTSDRVREALFAILGAAEPIEGARVLDLYAGTGALGLEALSRGASLAVFVERAREALDAIRANISALGVGAESRVVAAPLERAARGVREAMREGTFDLVFVDPPYADVPTGAVTRGVASVLAGESDAALLADGGRLVLEHGKNDAPPPLAGLALMDTRRYGDTCLSFYGKTSSPEKLAQ